MVKLSCATLSFEGFGETNFDKTFRMAPEIGYNHVEFNCWHPFAMTPSMIRSLKERCAETGLSPAAIHLSGGLGGDVCKDFCHKLWAMQAIRALGGRRVVTSGYARGQDGGIDSVIRSLRPLVPAAEELDVLICLENHYQNNLETIEDYRRIFEAIQSRHIGICIDTGHFDASGVDMDALIDEFSHKVNHIHLKENSGVGKKKFTRFGEGTTNNRHIVERMISLGYEGYLSVELSPEIGEHDGRPFTPADLDLPYKLFSVYVNRP